MLQLIGVAVSLQVIRCLVCNGLFIHYLICEQWFTCMNRSSLESEKGSLPANKFVFSQWKAADLLFTSLTSAVVLQFFGQDAY